MKKNSNLKMLFLFLATCLGIGILGGLVAKSSISTWYQTIYKPPWTAPLWVFAIAWTFFYLLLGYSLWLVFRKMVNRSWFSLPYLLFGLLLLLSFFWFFFFFVLQNPLLALIDILALWVLILATILSFSDLHVGGALLLVPYLLWITYIMSLNASIWWTHLY